MVTGALSMAVKRPGDKADHSLACVELYLHSRIHLHGMVLS